MAGGVLLAPGAAYAATATIAINSATAGMGGITVSVSVTNGSDPLGTFSVSGAGAGCTGTLFGMPSSGNGNGRCTIPSVGPGTYSVTASYDGASSSPASVTVGNPNPNPNPTPSGNAPVWSSDSPSTSVTGQTYSAQFQASGSPSYELVGAPSWLSIGANGVVSGNIPDGTNSFSFQVKAWNNFGFIMAGPFNVLCHHQNNYGNYHNDAFVNLHTSLYCTSPVYNGQRGTCTLWVTNSDYNYPWGPFGQYNNFGQNFASDVTGQISLPYQLRANFCGYGYSFFGCHVYGNTVTENLGNLYPGQSRSMTVHFTVRSGFNLWGYNPGHWFNVKVVGSASSNRGNFFFFGQGNSYSVTWVKIIPHGFWW
jgi:hypothetical protein